MRILGVGLVLVTMTIAMAGCLVGGKKGGSTRNPSEAPAGDSREIDFRKFGLRVLPAGDDPHVPSGNGAADALADVSVAAGEITFKKSIALPEPGKSRLFLVWDEDALGSSIHNAHYTHRILDSRNRPKGEPSREGVSYDSTHRRWFIPLAALLPGGEMDADPADSQLLTLDLQHSDGRRTQVELRFKLVGPLPLIQSRIRVESIQGTAKQWMKEIASAGWVLATEEFRNPSQRAVELWLRKDGANRFDVISTLANSFHTQVGNAPPSGPFVRDFWSKGALFLTAARILRSEGAEELALATGERSWIRVLLRPQERIAVEWKVSALPDATVCPWPVGEDRLFSWTVIQHSTRPCPGGSCTINWDQLIPVSQVMREGWAYEGVRLEGTLSREAMVSEVSLSSEEVHAGRGSLKLAPLSVPVGLGAERAMQEFPEDQAWSCMGLF
ncbi:MAG: hypothetical protein NDJ89_08985 [Oligoflexia bacterium]|nr:hypothetical protein [Oligoflexia bacterium]